MRPRLNRCDLFRPFAGFAVLVTAMPVAAQWCQDFSYSIFCDPFDQYVSDGGLRNVWRYTSWNYNTNVRCGSNMKLEDIADILPTPPYGGRHANGGDEGAKLGQNTVDLSGYIWGAIPGVMEVNGSDAQPLVLTFTMSAGFEDSSAMPFSSGYMELNLGDANGSVTSVFQAPTDYVLVGADNGAGCINCDSGCPSGQHSVQISWPTICQQEFPRTDGPVPCPPAQTFVRTAIAVGAFSMLDNNPCHCSSGVAFKVPQNEHLSYFDGLKWRILKQGMGGPGSSGNFVLGTLYDTVVMKVKTNTVDIYHKAKVSGIWRESWAYNLPRYYTGEFDRLRAGTDVGCELESTSYTCKATKRCIRMGEFGCDNSGWQTNNSKYISFDNVKLSGGVGNAVIGACCRSQALCSETDATTCQNVLGGVFQGPATSCAAASCCPNPFADSDRDGDVDIDDFGVLQACLTADAVAPRLSRTCACFDHSDDNTLDQADVESFVNCLTGPGIVPGSIPPECAQ